MGNQQERLSRDFMLGWLVAAIEGEGSITLAWGKHGKYIQLIPRINIVNKEQEFVNRAVEFSHELGVGVYVGNNKYNLLQVQWNGMKRVKAVLEMVLPHLGFKKERAELLLDFINRRLSGSKNRKYVLEDKEAFLKIREINGKGRIPVEELRLAFEDD